MLRIVDIKNTGYNYEKGNLTAKEVHFFPVDFVNGKDINNVE